MDNKKEESFQKPSRGAHVLVFPYPAQGHINPMIQFSKRLASKGLKVTMITTTNASFQSPSQQTNSFDLNFVTIFNGFHERVAIEDLDAYLKHQKACTCQSLYELLSYYNQNKMSLNPTPKLVIYDSSIPYVLDVVRKLGIEGASFFTQSCVISSIYYHAHEGTLRSSIKRKGSSSIMSLPSIKRFLRDDDLPSFVSSPNLYQPIVKMVLDQFSNLEEAKFVFVNTAAELEKEALIWMANKWPVKAIGPAIPSMTLDKRLPEDKDYGLSLFKPETKACIEWLDTKENASIVYMSIGSIASLGEEQMEEIANGLANCNKNFLWVVRDSEENKLPLNFKEKTLKNGLIVNWCPQLKVLGHRALGCFVTHCGWNSTIEAICLGVPMVAFPQWIDQPTNAKCIEDIWGVGVRVKVNEKGILTREEFEARIREVMEGEKAKEIKNNVAKWKKQALETMEEGGSSDRNVEEFTTKVLCS